MAQTTNESSAATGGMLVILGIIVAVAIVFLFFGRDIIGNRSASQDINIEIPRVEAPKIEAPKAEPPPAADVPAPAPAPATPAQ